MSPALPRLTQGGRFSGNSRSSSRNLILTKIFQAYAFPIWRYAPERGHSQCIYMREEIRAFKSSGCVFMLLYITLHSLYHCRLFTFIGANLSFGRQLCLPAHVCSHVLCSALSCPWAVWLESHCCLWSLAHSLPGREPETAQHSTTWCPCFQQSCASLL